MKSLRFVSIVCTLLAAQLAFASPSASTHAVSKHAPLNAMSDNWLGGFGVWSNPAHWSDGIPDLDSDVFIGTGNDYVSFDVSSSIRSLSLGAASGTSTLDGTLGQRLNVLTSFSITPFGSFYLANGGTLKSSDIANSGNLQLFTAQDRISTQGLTNYSTGLFDIGFGQATINQISNYGIVNVHNGQALLKVGGDFGNYGATNITNRAGLDSLGTFTNYFGATLNLDGPAASLIAANLINHGTINQIAGSLSTPVLVNSGSIQVDQRSRIQVGTGNAGESGYTENFDGLLSEVVGANYFGVLTVDGPATLDGQLQITLADEFVPLVGSKYRFLNFSPGELTGSFSDIQDPYFNDGLEMWQVDYENAAGFVQLVVVATPEPGCLLLLGTGLTAAFTRFRRITR